MRTTRPRSCRAPLAAALLLAACKSAAPSDPDGAVAPVTWDRGLPPSAQVQSAGLAARGLRLARGIIHLHSPYSHDACDGNPRPDGKPNAPCLANLRRGLCQTRMDFAMLTDHAVHMALEPDFGALFLAAPGDELLRGADATPTAARWRCEDQTSVVVTVGGENELMPVGLTRHLAATEAERSTAMHAETPAGIAAFQAAGALVLLPHGESRDIDLLRTLARGGLNGMEVYNLHANIDPKLRPYLGLDPVGAINSLAPWIAGRTVEEGGPEPDLAVLGFLTDNQNQLGKFDTLLSEGHHLAAVVGSDIHENTVPQLLADEERGDSYRRLMRWFSNHLILKAGPLTHDTLAEALGAGRSYGVFEVFGAPQGFDLRAEQGGKTFELGATLPASGAVLRLTPPRPLFSLTVAPPAAAPPKLRLRVLRVAAGDPTPDVVLDQTLQLGAEPPAEVTLRDLKPGAYRAEIRIVPTHLLPLLGATAETFRREYPYLYSSPLYLTP